MPLWNLTEARKEYWILVVDYDKKRNITRARLEVIAFSRFRTQPTKLRYAPACRMANFRCLSNYLNLLYIIRIIVRDDA